jgi:hypothetical protein
VTPCLTLVINTSSSNQSLYITTKPSLIIISLIISCFKESPIVFVSIIIINPSFYFSSLFNSAKPFKSSLL